MQKAQVGDGDDQKEYGREEILEKSRDWLQQGHIDVNEATMIESRLNKGGLMKANDKLDRKVTQLLKNAS